MSVAPAQGGEAEASGQDSSQEVSPSQVLVVRLAPLGVADDPAERDDTLDSLEAEAAALELRERHRLLTLDAVVYEVPGDVDEAARRLADVDGVVGVERDVAVQASERIPNDPRWGDQWGMRRVDAPAAWATTTGSPEVTIAILDTGVDADHPDLVGNVTGDAVDNLAVIAAEDSSSEGANFTDDGDPTDTADRHGHGTASAGVAAADSDNTEGIVGVCWDCRSLPVKVLGDDGSGMASDVAAGINYAVDVGADVLSLSLGSPTGTSLLDDAVTYAAKNDVVAVASAGNYGDQAEMYPAAFEDAVGVVASDRDDARYEFSSFGDWAEIAAPGCNPATDLTGGYKRYCGTSSAAPVVAGVVGLARTAEPAASVDDLRHALREGAAAFGEADWGRVDAAATLAELPDAGDRDLNDDLDDADDTDDADDALDDPTETDDPREEQTGDPGVTQRRLSGVDRFATAARLSTDAFADDGGLLDDVVDGANSERAYLTSGLTSADALAAGPAAGSSEAPVLLTARDTLPKATADELARLNPEEVVVVGGTSAVAEDTAEAAGDAAAASTSRLAGRGRYATAAEVALATFEEGAEVAYVATGLDYADALAGVPAAVVDDAPMLLTDPDQLPDVVAGALTELAPDRVVVLGGTSAVSSAVAGELGEIAGDGGVERLAGDGRFATAAAVADRFTGDVDSVHLATGFDFPDALAAGPIAGLGDGPLLLVGRDELPDATAEQLRRLAPGANVTMGGKAVISDVVQSRAASLSAEGARDG